MFGRTVSYFLFLLFSHSSNFNLHLFVYYVLSARLELFYFLLSEAISGSFHPVLSLSTCRHLSVLAGTCSSLTISLFLCSVPFSRQSSFIYITIVVTIQDITYTAYVIYSTITYRSICYTLL